MRVGLVSGPLSQIKAGQSSISSSGPLAGINWVLFQVSQAPALCFLSMCPPAPLSVPLAPAPFPSDLSFCSFSFNLLANRESLAIGLPFRLRLSGHFAVSDPLRFNLRSDPPSPLNSLLSPVLAP